MLDFPASPVLNQQFSAANSSWVWDGTAWNIVPQMVPAVASDTPPANPAVGQFWWRASNGQLYVYYDDGNTKQWVQAAASADVIAEPYPFKTADMSLRSLSAGNIRLNSKADGSGTDALRFNANGITYVRDASNAIAFKWTSFLSYDIDGGVGVSRLWADANNIFSVGGNGYHKFANGLILQWGQVVNSANDYSAGFPIAFPGGYLCAVGCVIADAQVTNTSIYTVAVQAKSNTAMDVRTRYQSGAATGAAGSIQIAYMVVGY